MSKTFSCFVLFAGFFVLCSLIDLFEQTQVGPKLVHNIARWDGSMWQAMTDDECRRQCTYIKGESICEDRNCELGGPVTALASMGATVYAAGMFSSAGGRPARNLARYFLGFWRPVLGGVDGSVFDLKVLSLESLPPFSHFQSGILDVDCLYVAGDLKSVIHEDGTAQKIRGLARVCPDGGTWSMVHGTENLGPVLALHVPAKGSREV